LPAFPVDSQTLSAVKLRVNTARELDKLLLAAKKEEVSKSWFKKAAEEADLVVSESDDEDEFGEPKSKVQADHKSQIKSKRAELHSMLATPMHSQGFSGKYPTMSGRLQLPTDFQARADDTKSAVKAVSKSKAELKAILKGPKALRTMRTQKNNKRKKN
jgi:ATP-dependent RNA helicase DDX24/MAK5